MLAVLVMLVSLPLALTASSPGTAWQSPPPPISRRVQTPADRPRSAAVRMELEQVARREVLRHVGRAAGLLLLAGEPSRSLATVSWPAVDGGLVKTMNTKQHAATSPGHVAPDGREQLMRKEVDLSRIPVADLPKGEAGVREGVRRLVVQDPKIAAGLLRLAFHDAVARDTEAGTGGANGSIRFELDRRANYGLTRPFQALAPIQFVAGLSWADTIAVAGAEAVAAAGGPRIAVSLGRRDSSSADPLQLTRPLGQCQGPTVPGGGVSCRGQVQTALPDAGLGALQVPSPLSMLVSPTQCQTDSSLFDNELVRVPTHAPTHALLARSNDV